MSEDKAKKTEEKSAGAAEKPKGGPLPPNILFLAIIGGIVLVNLLVVVILVSGMKPPKADAATESVSADSSHAESSGEHGEAHGEEKKDAKADAHGEKAGAGEAEPEAEFPKKPIEAVVNVAGTDGERVLKIALKPAFIELGKKKGGGGHGHGGGGGPLDAIEPKAKDLLIDIVSQMTLGELSEPDARDKIRKEFLTRLNAIIPSHMHIKIVNVYIDMFIIQ